MTEVMRNSQNETSVISSYLLRAPQDDVPHVVEALEQIPGVEVHDIVDYNIAVSLELPTLHETEIVARSFQDIPGVLTVNLIYVNFEDDPVIGLNAPSPKTVEDLAEAGFTVEGQKE